MPLASAAHVKRRKQARDQENIAPASHAYLSQKAQPVQCSKHAPDTPQFSSTTSQVSQNKRFLGPALRVAIADIQNVQMNQLVGQRAAKPPASSSCASASPQSSDSGTASGKGSTVYLSMAPGSTEAGMFTPAPDMKSALSYPAMIGESPASIVSKRIAMTPKTQAMNSSLEWVLGGGFRAQDKPMSNGQQGSKLAAVDEVKQPLGSKTEQSMPSIGNAHNAVSPAQPMNVIKHVPASQTVAESDRQAANGSTFVLNTQRPVHASEMTPQASHASSFPAWSAGMLAAIALPEEDETSADADDVESWFCAAAAAAPQNHDQAATSASKPQVLSPLFKTDMQSPAQPATAAAKANGHPFVTEETSTTPWWAAKSSSQQSSISLRQKSNNQQELSATAQSSVSFDGLIKHLANGFDDSQSNHPTHKSHAVNPTQLFAPDSGKKSWDPSSNQAMSPLFSNHVLESNASDGSECGESTPMHQNNAMVGSQHQARSGVEQLSTSKATSRSANSPQPSGSQASSLPAWSLEMLAALKTETTPAESVSSVSSKRGRDVTHVDIGKQSTTPQQALFATPAAGGALQRDGGSASQAAARRDGGFASRLSDVMDTVQLASPIVHVKNASAAVESGDATNGGNSIALQNGQSGSIANPNNTSSEGGAGGSNQANSNVPGTTPYGDMKGGTVRNPTPQTGKVATAALTKAMARVSQLARDNLGLENVALELQARLATVQHEHELQSQQLTASEGQIATLKQQLQTSEGKVEELLQDIASMALQLAESKAATDSLEALVSSLRDDCSKHQIRAEQAEEAATALQTQLTAAEQMTVDLQQQLEQQRQQMASEDERYKNLKSELELSAENSKSLQAQLKAMTMQFSASERDARQAHQSLVDSQKVSQSLREQVNELNGQLEGMQSESQSANQAAKQSDLVVHQLTSQVNDLASQLQLAKQDGQLTQQQLQSNRTLSQQLREQLKDAALQLEVSEIECIRLRKQLQESKQAEKVLQREVDTLTSQLASTDHDAGQTQLQLQQREKACDALKEEIARLTDQLDIAARDSVQARQRLEQSQETCKQLQTQIQSISEQMADQQAQSRQDMATIQNTNKMLTQELVQLRDLATQLHNKVAAQNEAHRAEAGAAGQERARLLALQSLLEQHEVESRTEISGLHARLAQEAARVQSLQSLLDQQQRVNSEQAEELQSLAKKLAATTLELKAVEQQLAECRQLMSDTAHMVTQQLDGLMGEAVEATASQQLTLIAGMRHESHELRALAAATHRRIQAMQKEAAQQLVDAHHKHEEEVATLAEELDGLHDQIAGADLRHEVELSEVRDELADKEKLLQNSARKIADLEAQLVEMQREHQTILQQCRDLLRQLNDKQATSSQVGDQPATDVLFVQLNHTITQKDNQLQSQKNQLSALRVQLASTQEDYQAALQQCQNLRETLNAAQNSQTEAEGMRQQEMTGLQQQNKELRSRLDQAQAEYKAAVSKVTALRANLAQQQQLTQQQHEQLSNVRNELSVKAVQCESTLAQLKQSSDECLAAKNALTVASQRAEALQAEVRKLQTELDVNKQSLQTAQAHGNELQRDLVATASKLQTVNKRVMMLETQLETFRNKHSNSQHDKDASSAGVTLADTQKRLAETEQQLADLTQKNCKMIKVLKRLSREGSAIHQLEALRRENQELCCQYTACKLASEHLQRAMHRLSAENDQLTRMITQGQAPQAGNSNPPQ